MNTESGEEFGEREWIDPQAPTTGETARGDGKVQEKPASDPVSVATETLRRCTWGALTPDGRTVAAALRARVARRVSGEERPVVTPWPNLNAAMGGGFWPGLHVLVGSTGTGKSQFAMQLAVTGGVPVLYLALELDALGLYTRAAALLCHGRMADESGRPLAVSWSDFYTGRVQAPEHVDEELAAVPLHWMEAPPHGFAYDLIAPHVAALRALHPTHTGPVVIVVDFLQLVAGTNPREDLRERIGRASYACRAAARDHDAVVLALSSTARNNNISLNIDAPTDDNPDPKREPLSNLVGLGKESGDVEYSADSVLTFCPEAWPDGEKPPPGGKRVHVAVAKIRAGAPSWCVLAFDGTCFTEPPPPPTREPDEIIRGKAKPGKPKRGNSSAKRYGSGSARPDTDTDTEPDPFTGEPIQ